MHFRRLRRSISMLLSIDSLIFLASASAANRFRRCSSDSFSGGDGGHEAAFLVLAIPNNEQKTEFRQRGERGRKRGLGTTSTRPPLEFSNVRFCQFLNLEKNTLATVALARRFPNHGMGLGGHFNAG